MHEEGRSEGRSVVVAIFRERSSAERAIAKDEAIAAAVEQFAAEAVLVNKEADGALAVVRSDHSPGRSLATMTAKLMVVIPLGFHGVLATTVAGLELAAAGRERGEPSELSESDLRVLSDRMEPGWSAVVAVYLDRYLAAAVSAFDTLGAVTVWQAPEADIERAIAELDE